MTSGQAPQWVWREATDETGQISRFHTWHAPIDAPLQIMPQPGNQPYTCTECGSFIYSEPPAVLLEEIEHRRYMEERFS